MEGLDHTVSNEKLSFYLRSLLGWANRDSQDGAAFVIKAIVRVCGMYDEPSGFSKPFGRVPRSHDGRVLIIHSEATKADVFLIDDIVETLAALAPTAEIHAARLKQQS